MKNLCTVHCPHTSNLSEEDMVINYGPTSWANPTYPIYGRTVGAQERPMCAPCSNMAYKLLRWTLI
ncbi:unnamed protein product [Prunus armeniaca]